MNNINIIVNAISALTPQTIKQLEMSGDREVMTLIVNSCARATHNSMSFWKERLDDPASEGVWPRATNEIRMGSHSLRTCFSYLDWVSKYREAGDSLVFFEKERVDGETGEIRKEDNDPQQVAVQASPYLWAKLGLIKKGIWPMDEGTPISFINDEGGRRYETLTMLSLDSVVTKTVGRLVGQIALSLATDGKMPKRISRDLLIAQLWNGLSAFKLLSEKKQQFQLLEMAKESTPYIDQIPVPVSEIVAAWKTLVERDELESEEAEMATELKETRRNNAALVQGVKLAAINAATIDALLKAGQSFEAIRNMGLLPALPTPIAPPVDNSAIEQELAAAKAEATAVKAAAAKEALAAIAAREAMEAKLEAMAIKLATPAVVAKPKQVRIRNMAPPATIMASAMMAANGHKQN